MSASTSNAERAAAFLAADPTIARCARCGTKTRRRNATGAPDCVICACDRTRRDPRDAAWKPGGTDRALAPSDYHPAFLP